jgi:hypothetical protein
MQQRQPRLGDVLDDYCPRERRLTNHVVVAMVGDNVKQTRCTTCDADHEYKQAKLPRLRRKTEPPAALAAQGFGAPKLHDQASRPEHEGSSEPATEAGAVAEDVSEPAYEGEPVAAADAPEGDAGDAADTDDNGQPTPDEGPVHRRLIRASLPRTEGQAPPTRPNPEFTIRQPNNNRQNRFRPRHQRGGPQQSNGNGSGNRSFGGGFSGHGQRPHRQQGGGNRAGGAAAIEVRT